ncbi:hypothetical protein MCOR18_011112, partial [Pyricularia oryzae]
QPQANNDRTKAPDADGDSLRPTAERVGPGRAVCVPGLVWGKLYGQHDHQVPQVRHLRPRIPRHQLRVGPQRIHLLHLILRQQHRHERQVPLPVQKAGVGLCSLWSHSHLLRGQRYHKISHVLFL